MQTDREHASQPGRFPNRLAAGQVDEEAFAALLTGTLPQLADGPEALAWVSEHDTIDYGLMEQARRNGWAPADIGAVTGGRRASRPSRPWTRTRGW